MSDVDYLGSKAASEALAQRARDWWAKRGYSVPFTVHREKFGSAGIWVIRTPYQPDFTRKETVE